MKKLSKKNNRKNRALKFIRNKNFISRGNMVSRSFKISTSAIKNTDVVNPAVQDMYDSTVRWLKKKYKIKFMMEAVSTSCGQQNDDFIKMLFTVVINLRRKGF